MPADLGEEGGNGTRIGLAEDKLRCGHYLEQLTSNPNALRGLVGVVALRRHVRCPPDSPRVPPTRIASIDAIRPLPASGAREKERRA